jgi:hypothetical protein
LDGLAELSNINRAAGLASLRQNSAFHRARHMATTMGIALDSSLSDNASQQ